jgi:hypothetical protein
MKAKTAIRAERVDCEALRECALEVLGATYRDEKRWVRDAASQLPLADLWRQDIAWFLVFADGEPAGVVRVLYSPPLAQYRQYGLRFLRDGIDVDAFLARYAIAEIGRFAVVPQARRNTAVVLALLREAIADTVRRGFTHYITDVFEGETHSPYAFHTRVLGFVPVATHDTGELHCSRRRITMLLDLRECYARLRAGNGYFYRLVTEGWEEALHTRLARGAASLATESAGRTDRSSAGAVSTAA